MLNNQAGADGRCSVKTRSLILSLTVPLLVACGSAPETDTVVEPPAKKTLFKRLPSSHTGVDFNNVLDENDSINILTYQYTYNGAGVAAADFNSDGLLDLYFAGNFSPGKLYFNRGGMQFDDVTQSSGIITEGWCTGVSIVDINNDGLQDLYISRSGPTKNIGLRQNLLYVNKGNGTFSEEAEAYGIADDGHSTQAYFFDHDQDGDMDLFVLNHSVNWDHESQKQHVQHKAYNDHTTPRLYRNDGGRFTDVSEQAGIMANAFSLAAAIFDINNDGLQDIYVCNDYLMNDFLYINMGNGTFVDRIHDFFPHTSFFSMGVDVCDINNDGLLDLYSLDMLPEDHRRHKLNPGFMERDRYMLGVEFGYGYQLMQNALQLNNGDGTFSDISDMAGVARTDWSWAPVFGDLDNDGHKDVIVTNGFRRDFTNLDFINYSMAGARVDPNDREGMRRMIEMIPTDKIPNHSYRNNGDLTFSDMAEHWGTSEPGFSHGLVLVDLDNDGDLDVVMNNLDDEAFIYENLLQQQTPAPYLQVELNASAAQCVGSLVRVVAAGTEQLMDVQPARGYLSSAKAPLHFGLGHAHMVDTLEVYWNDGRYQLLLDVPADTLLVIQQQASGERRYAPRRSQPVLEEHMDLFDPPYMHVDNEDYTDFKREPLLLRMYSRDGPPMAVADVNGDGRDDLFIGGAKDQPGTLYLQTTQGTFQKQEQIVLAGTAGREDMSAVFFDADGDGDMDLYVVSGSNEIPAPSPYYHDRLYFNDGNGLFALAPPGMIPATEHSGSCAVVADIDGDGDLDIFRGSRMFAGRWPMAGRSHIMYNDGRGRFTDVTQQVCADLLMPGMVTAAAFTDLDADGMPDLVLAGEWMPIRTFQNAGGKFVERTSTWLAGEHTSGNWLSLTPMDVDNDGDMDLVCGNIGRNMRIQVSPERPAVLYYNDYDRNGTVDPVITCYFPQGRFPYFDRDHMIDQMRFLRKRFNTYAEYADRTYEEIFTPLEREGERFLMAHRHESVWLRNDGGRFTLIPLPNEAQIFPVFAAVASDVDEDGQEELLLTGNAFHMEINTGRLDAGRGAMLKYDPAAGELRALSRVESGLNTPDDARSMVVLRTAKGNVVAVGSNSGPMRAFRKAVVSKRLLP